MRIISPIAIASACFLVISALPAQAAISKQQQKNSSTFVFRDKNGKVVSAPVVDQYQPGKITRPAAKMDKRIDARLVRAATIAQERAHAHSKSRCWHYVKEALAGVVDSRPKTVYAKQAADELVRDYGFKKLPIQDPYAAPIGSVLVYGARSAAGHIEIRTKNGFVSDFRSQTPSKRQLIAVLTKA